MFCGSVAVVDVVWAGFHLNPHPLKTEGAAPKGRSGRRKLALRRPLLVLVLRVDFWATRCFDRADFFLDFGDFVGFHVGREASDAIR